MAEGAILRHHNAASIARAATSNHARAVARPVPKYILLRVIIEREEFGSMEQGRIVPVKVVYIRGRGLTNSCSGSFGFKGRPRHTSTSLAVKEARTVPLRAEREVPPDMCGALSSAPQRKASIRMDTSTKNIIKALSPLAVASPQRTDSFADLKAP